MNYFCKRVCQVAGFALVAAFVQMPASAQLIGPYPGPNTPYLSFADSPFFAGSFSYFHLEDFEDHLFNTPGASADVGGVTSVVFGPSIHDSVDADDGLIDGSGLNGDSYFEGNGASGIRFSFSAGALGALPTHAGIVWTDGAGDITFEAFDENGVSLGTVGGNHANFSFNGETDEDRFYGIIHGSGISAIHIKNSGGGIEVDHLQYGLRGNPPSNGVPEPGVFALMAGTAAFGIGLSRRRTNK